MNARTITPTVLAAHFVLAFSALCVAQTPVPYSLNAKPKTVIEASELARRARNGLGIRVDNTVIRGRLDLSYRVIERQFSITNCDFQEEPDLSYSTFKRHVVLEGSTFRKGAKFESMTVDYNAHFDRARFLAGEANFRYLQVHGTLTARAAQFANGVNVIAAGAHFDKDVDLSNADFGGPAIFYGAEAHSDLSFDAATFRQQIVLTTAKIGGSLFLRDSHFFGPALFAGIQVTYNVRAERAVFKDYVNLTDSQISSFLDLSRARFESTDKPVHFVRANVARGGYFDGVEFAGRVKFDGAHFNADASFDQAVFNHVVSFDRARFDQTVHFEHCSFKDNVSFHQTSFGSLLLSQNGQVQGKDQFGGTVDLRGCTYDRVQVRWQSLFRMYDGSPRLTTLDQQPYSQLLKSYQAAGDNDTANEVLLEWHRLKRQEIFRSSKFRWLADCLSWLTSNYGVAPGRLLEISALLLLLGMLIFSRPGAVLRSATNGQPNVERTDNAMPIRLPHWEAVAVSLHQFLPIEVPFGSEWIPTSDLVTLRLTHRYRGVIILRMRPSTYATVLKISGYILVPLEIVVLNGLLNPVM